MPWNSESNGKGIICIVVKSCLKETVWNVNSFIAKCELSIFSCCKKYLIEKSPFDVFVRVISEEEVRDMNLEEVVRTYSDMLYNCIDVTALDGYVLRINCRNRIENNTMLWMCLNCFGDTAWRKHFSKAAPFLHEILHSLLSVFLPAADKPKWCVPFGIFTRTA